MTEREEHSFDRLDQELRSQIRDLIPLPFAASVLYVPLLAVSILLGLFVTDSLPGRQTGGMALLEQIGLGALVGLGMIAITRVLAMTVGSVAKLEREFEGVLFDLPGRQVIWLAILAGFAEEAFFRGVLQHWIGYPLTSIVFGLVHFVPGSKVHVPWTILAIGAGFILGGVYQETGSLVAPITAHCVYNLTHVAILSRNRPRRAKAVPQGEAAPPEDGAA